jgi:predicted kinase
MAQEDGVKSIIHLLTPHIAVQNNEDLGSIVIMMCGVSGPSLTHHGPRNVDQIGAGKSTLSYAIVEAFPSFTCLSIDAIIAERHGIFSVDYPASEYDARSADAREVFSAKLVQLLEQKKHVVLDRSFYAKKHRDEFRDLVERASGRLVLVYLKAERDVLWKRICERREKGVNAHSAREIGLALLGQFVEGFEAPEGEGEIIITVE